MNNDKTIAALNDLLNITNDRIAGFAKVADKVWDNYSELRPAYDTMVREASEMKSDLISLINSKGGSPDDTTSVSGAIHRAWIDLKNSLAGDKAESTLENVVFGEKAAIEAYENALESGDLCLESTTVVNQQLGKLRASYAKFDALERVH